jgi:hypothetical protein
MANEKYVLFTHDNQNPDLVLERAANSIVNYVEAAAEIPLPERLVNIALPEELVPLVKMQRERWSLGNSRKGLEKDADGKIPTAKLIEHCIRLDTDRYQQSGTKYRLRFVWNEEFRHIQLVAGDDLNPQSVIPERLSPKSVSEIEETLWARERAEDIFDNVPGLLPEEVILLWQDRIGLGAGMREEILNFVALYMVLRQLPFEDAREVINRYVADYLLPISLKRTKTTNGKEVYSHDPMNYKVAAAVAIATNMVSTDPLNDKAEILERFNIKVADFAEIEHMARQLVDNNNRNGQLTLVPLYNKNARIVGRLEIVRMMCQTNADLLDAGVYDTESERVKRVMMEILLAMTLRITTEDIHYEILANITDEEMEGIVDHVFEIK